MFVVVHQVVSAGVRVAMVSFGTDGWFLGMCIVYLFAAVFLVYTLVDYRIPIDSPEAKRKRNKGKESHWRLSEFLSRGYPDDESAPESARMRIMQGFTKTTKVSTSEAIFVLLHAFFVAALIVNANVIEEPVSWLGQPQWVLGVCAIAVVGCFALGFATVWSWRYSNWLIDLRTGITMGIMQALFSAGGIVFYFAVARQSDAGIFVVTFLTAGPALALSFTFTVRQFLRQDWRLTQPAEKRNPPMQGFCSAFWRGGLPVSDYQLYLGIFGTLGSMAALAITISVKYPNGVWGWSIAFVLFILLTSIIPLLKVPFALRA